MPSADDRADTQTAWTSLRRSATVAKALLGPARGHDALERWVRLQVERTRDPSFAALFADAPRPPGVRIEDHLHRVVERDGLRLLGGIRHFGSDPTRPFVEIVAWTPLSEETARESPWHDAILERVRAAAAHEWRAFSPLDVRVLRPEANRAPPAPPRDRRVDQYVHVADVRTMVAKDGDDGATSASGARTTLAPFDDLDAALALVENRYAALERENPTLARDVTPADRETLAECRAAGSLHAIRAHGHTVGLIATLPGTIDWLDCHVVVEEVVSLEHAGRGHASAAQRALAAHLVRVHDGRKPGHRLLGRTIDARNVASIGAASRAGRAAVFRHDFLPVRGEGLSPSGSDRPADDEIERPRV